MNHSSAKYNTFLIQNGSFRLRFFDQSEWLSDWLNGYWLLGEWLIGDWVIGYWAIGQQNKGMFCNFAS